MKDKIETDKIWIDVETLAILKNITKRAVRLSLNKNKYEYKILLNYPWEMYVY